LDARLQSHNLEFIHLDLLSRHKLKDAVKDCETIFHLAANPEVKTGSTNPETHYQQNIAATFNLLEALRKAGNNKTLTFTSSSTVYGEATRTPTPEDYTPLKPISIYGATKLACEALITAYAYTYGFKALIYRLANIVGPRNKHGVIHDFIQKLRKNPKELEILGDGTQTKSYLYISDCIEAMLIGIEKSKNQVEIYNVGSEDQITTTQIAQIIIKELGLKN
jgi:UDP-glucose 4-epimerase